MTAETEEPPQFDDEKRLLRRIPNKPSMYTFDHNKQCWRPTSANFSDPDLSVDCRDLLEADGETIEYSIHNYPGYGLAQFTAATARNIDQSFMVLPDPLPENPYHGLVKGKKSKTAKRAFVDAVEVLIEPTSDTDN